MKAMIAVATYVTIIGHMFLHKSGVLAKFD